MPILPPPRYGHKLHVNQKSAWPFYMDHCQHDGMGKDETFMCPWLLNGILYNNLETARITYRWIFIKMNLKKQRIFYTHYHTLFTHNIKAFINEVNITGGVFDTYPA